MPFFYKKSFRGHNARERLFTFTDCVAGVPRVPYYICSLIYTKPTAT
jgi:hypothetical protein